MIAKRQLGNSAAHLSIIGLGGIVVVGMQQDEADAIVRDSVERGVTYFDVAPSYANGEAETKLGYALRPHRESVFLACKTGKRDRAGALVEMHQSLERLRTDHFDLYQMHGLTSVDEVRQALGPGGAMEAFVEAREKGIVRLLGFSAHSEAAALEAMAGFDFDTVLFPFNWVCWSQGFGPQVLKEARKRGMGCLALKAMASGPLPHGEQPQHPKCWYRPETDPSLAEEALRFTLSLDVTAAVPPGDEGLYAQALSYAERFRPMKPADRDALLARAAGIQPIFTV